MEPMTYEAAVAALGGALRFGIHASLSGIRALAEELGRPQDAFVSVQVTGTNGKTSTSRFLASILAAPVAGLAAVMLALVIRRLSR